MNTSQTTLHFWTIAGLALSLIGPFILIIIRNKNKSNPFSYQSRIVLWAISVMVICIVLFGEKLPLSSIGVNAINIKTILLGVVSSFLLMIIFPITQFVNKLAGIESKENSYKDLVSLSVGNRIFIVITASVIEEVLFRGYAIERLYPIIGNIWVAGLVALLFFTIAHISTWSLVHLLPVFLSGMVLTIIYIITRNLIICIIAHLVVDSTGFILMPYLIKLKNKA